MIFRTILFLALFFDCSASYGQQSPNQSNDPSSGNTVSQPIEIQNSALDSIQRDIRVLVTSTAAEQVAMQDQLNRDIESIRIASVDLEAQQSMADATWWILIVSAFGLIVGVVTIYFLGVNISQTRSIIELERAWITPYISDTFTHTTNNTAFETHYAFKWVNSGRTPAVKVRHRLGKVQTDTINQTELARVALIDEDKFTWEEWAVEGPLGSNQVFARTYSLSSDMLTTLANPKVSNLVRMDVVYETIFGSEKKNSSMVWRMKWDAEKRVLNLQAVGHNTGAS